MREYRDGYDFSHDLLRETAYTLISPPKRWLLHRRVAQAADSRLRSAAQMASAQGSVALLRRCEGDLSAPPPAGVRHIR
jgi:hypothetical protein